jgi:Questin oxidase-like
MTAHAGRAETILNRLLVESRGLSVEFGHCLANHLPMLLVILSRLGASNRRLEDYFQMYYQANSLRPPPPRVAPIGPADWTRHLGDRTRETDYRVFFAAELRRLGVRDLQRHYLPILLPGVCASALHALMRLAYGYLDDCPDEIALALAYWATTFLPLAPAMGAAPVTVEPGQVLTLLTERRDLLDVHPECDLLWHAMRAVGRHPSFAPVVDWLTIDATTLERCAGAALALFASTGDFCALHALTGAHWIRLLPAEAANRTTLLRYFWQGVASVYPKMGMPPVACAEELAALRVADCPPWPDIAAAAVASDDEHDPSLVFSAMQEEAVYRDPAYRRVAARRVGLLGA